MQLKKPLLTLPESKSVPCSKITDYTWLIYGERKIGKTELASHFDDPFFLFFEPGGRAQKLRARFVNSWDEFLQYITLLESKPDYCRTVVIDVGGKCYDLAFEYACRKLGIEHPQDDAGGGKGWKTVEKTFIEAHNRLFALGVGIVVLAHSEVKEIRRKDGSKYDKFTLQLGAQPFRYYAGTFDTIAYYQYDDDGNRILTIRGDANIEAGTRCRDNFLYTDGMPVVHIPMGTNSDEGYKNLVNAFNNKLLNPTVKVKKEKK